jgi:hypothetical protein
MLPKPIACVPPATITFTPATTDASRNRAACGGNVPRATSSSSEFARTTNFRMFTGQSFLYY